MFIQPSLAVVLCCFLFTAPAQAQQGKKRNARDDFWMNEKPELVASHPDHLPTMGYQKGAYNRKTGGQQTLVTVEFPELPGQIFDAWCYEGRYVELLSANDLGGGRLELPHRFASPPVLLVTTATPEPQSVEFVARVELDEEAAKQHSDEMRTPELCFQMRRAPLFGSSGPPYAHVVARSFVLTKEGLIPEESKLEERTWRVKVYLSKDDRILLERAAKDFPEKLSGQNISE